MQLFSFVFRIINWFTRIFPKWLMRSFSFQRSSFSFQVSWSHGFVPYAMCFRPLQLVFVVAQSVLSLVVSTSSRSLLSVFDTPLGVSDSFLAFWYDPTSFRKILPQNLNDHFLWWALVPFSWKEFPRLFTDCSLGAMLIDTRLVIYRSLQRWS